MSERRRPDDELDRLADEQEEVEAATLEAGAIGGIAPGGDRAPEPAIETGGDEQLPEIEAVHDAHVDGEPEAPAGPG